MSRISRNISIILRTERLIAQRHLAIMAKRAGMVAAAGLVAGIGLIMLNVAAYLALSDVQSKPVAALIVALANLLLAGLLFALASRANADAETAPVAELRDLAIEDLEAEVQAGVDGAKQTVEEFRTMARNPLGTIAPALAMTIARIIAKSMKDSPTPEPEQESDPDANP